MEESDEERRLQTSAEELQAAIITVLFRHNDPSQLRMANNWITTFLSSSLAWSVSLYLAFPPPGSNVGLQQEVRFFSLNLLLSKFRTDWLELAASDAREIYDVLIRQLPSNRHDKIVGPRLCVVVGAAATLAGADTCYELLENAVGESELELALKINLLTSLAEETLHRAHSLPWAIKDCMQDCCSQVLLFLDRVVVLCGQSDILGNAFTCFERWIQAGTTLSELYSECPSLYSSLLGGLGSSSDAVFQPAVWALSELISQVDILPGREEAVCAIIKAILAQKWQYDAAAGSQGMHRSAGLLVHARGLCLLVSEIASVEGALLARSGMDGANLLEWLVDASRGGGGLELEGALMAVEAWPRLVAIPHSQRGTLLQTPFFGAAAQAVLQAAKYPPTFTNWKDLQLEEEYFNRFRNSIADGALIALLKELNGMFLSLILEVLHGASFWQDAELCLFVASSLSKEVVTIQDEASGTSFLNRIFTWLLGSTDGSGHIFRQNDKFLETSALLLEHYAEWIAFQGRLMEQSIQYAINALYVCEVRVKAANTLKTLCCTAAHSSITIGWSLELLIESCEAGLSVAIQLPKDQERQVQTAVVQGLASLVAVLPPANAEIALTRLTFGAVSTVNEIVMHQERNCQQGTTLESALTVVSAAIEYGALDDGRMHPAVCLLRDIWPALESLTVTWASDAVVAAALCQLWGVVASKMGLLVVEVLPGIITAASSMFKLHRAAAPLVCLSKVARLVSLRPTLELEKSLAAMLHEVTSVLGNIDKAMTSIEETGHTYSNTKALIAEDEDGDEDDTDLECSLCMMYELGGSFLQYFPALFLPSTAFLQIFCSATASISRKDPNVALAAAKFLSESILGVSNGTGVKEEQGMCNGSPELMSYVDQAIVHHAMLIVQTILRQLASSGAVQSLKEALVDVLYALCLRYATVTEAAFLSTLNAADFPGKRGFMLDSDKKQFLAATFHNPPLPRIRFQELMRVFCGVCQTLSPPEALQQF